MNNIAKKLLFTLLLSALAVAGKAQEPLEDVVNALRSNRIGDMEKYFDNVVPVTINNVQTVYSRTQGEIVLKDFFSRNAPSDFTIQNSGSPNNTSKFALGEFVTPSGKFSFYVLLKQKDNYTYLLQDIRFNKE